MHGALEQEILKACSSQMIPPEDIVNRHVERLSRATVTAHAAVSKADLTRSYLQNQEHALKIEATKLGRVVVGQVLARPCSTTGL